MEVIYGLIPGMLLLGLIAVGVLFWAARSGQFEDLDGDGQRILMDDDIRPEDARRFPDADCDRHAERSAADREQTGEQASREP